MKIEFEEKDIIFLVIWDNTPGDTQIKEFSPGKTIDEVLTWIRQNIFDPIAYKTVIYEVFRKHYI